MDSIGVTYHPTTLALDHKDSGNEWAILDAFGRTNGYRHKTQRWEYVGYTGFSLRDAYGGTREYDSEKVRDLKKVECIGFDRSGVPPNDPCAESLNKIGVLEECIGFFPGNAFGRTNGHQHKTQRRKDVGYTGFSPRDAYGRTREYDLEKKYRI